jgi:GR25 family glycosyltransferase involved in LPS biosynthesis
MNHIIVINLERAVDRREQLEKQFKELDVSDYTFYPAFDSANVRNSFFKVPIMKGVGIGRSLSATELSIIMSHVSALKFAKVMGYDNVVILEDDVVICEDWKWRIDILLEDLPKDWEYVYLAGHSDYVKIPMFDNPTIIKAPKMVGAFSYMVNQIGIEKLIKYCGEFMTTYDDMITHKIEAGKLNAYLYIPFMTYHTAGKSYNWDITCDTHTSFKYFKNKIES